MGLSYVSLALIFISSGANTNEISRFVNHGRWGRNRYAESLLKKEEEDKKKVE